MSIKKLRSGSLREKTSLRVASGYGSFKQYVPRFIGVDETTRDPIVWIMRVVLL